MIYVVICLVALLASGLTLFSGFGLGTILTPAFALFFPIELAIALTAIVHFLNNLFKLSLLGRHASKRIVIRFGLPSIVFAFLGAWLLDSLSAHGSAISYSLFGHFYTSAPLKLLIAVLMIFFALMDLIPRLAKLSFPAKLQPLGGALTGFFGGLSGHQGALRSAFLIRSGLSKESFIATGVVIACMVDFTRLAVYSTKITDHLDSINYLLLILASFSAFCGAWFGSRMLKKATFKAVQYIVAVLLIIIAILLGLGII